MTDTFDYDQAPPDFDTVSAVVSDITHTPMPSDDELEQRRIEHEQWRVARQQADEQRRLECEQGRQKRQEAERAEVARQDAIARAERQRKINAELAEQSRRQSHDRTLTGLLDHAIKQRQFRNSYTKSAKLAHSRQRLSAALGDAVALHNPPPPEPITVVVQQEERRECGFRQSQFRCWQMEQETAFVVVTNGRHEAAIYNQG